MSGPIPFEKMHGLGNDFVVIDARTAPIALSAAAAARIADRRTGVGCDQLIILEPSPKGADVFMRIRNNDGSEAGACGNATRCVADKIMHETGAKRAVVETLAGLLETSRAGGDLVTVDMGQVRTDWRHIPLAREMDTLHLGIEVGMLKDPAAVNVGNPHASFVVDDADAVPLETLGPIVENHALFPERTNVQVVQVLSSEKIRVRVWERGAGLTLASGSSAVATAANAHRRGLVGRKIEVVLDGGSLFVEWRDDNHITQTGPFATSFLGTIDPRLLGENP